MLAHTRKCKASELMRSDVHRSAAQFELKVTEGGQQVVLSADACPPCNDQLQVRSHVRMRHRGHTLSLRQGVRGGGQSCDNFSA